VNRRWILLLPLLMMAALVSAQETPISPTLDAELDEIEAWVVETRGLQPTGDVIRVFPSREEVADYLTNEINEQLPADTVREATAFYVAFDFMEPETDILGIYLRLLQDQVGGFYDTEDKTMNTILLSGGELGDNLPALEETIYAHEFVHAMQDQNFGLEAIGLSDEGIETLTTDQIVALQSLVEGDATLVMNLYTEKIIEERPMAAFGLLSGSLASGSVTMPEGTPPILLRELTFPYLQGAEFAAALYQDADSWSGVDAAYTDLPQSSEHILHPETYLNGDAPLPVTLADTTAALGDGWTAFDEDTLGEFYIRAYLDTQLDRPTWEPAAVGWGGDRYQTFVNDNGSYAFVLRTTWDSPADADEFYNAFLAFGAARSGDIGREAGCWVTTADTLCAMQLPDGDTVISRAPTAATAQALLASQTG